VFLSRNYRLIVGPWKFDVLKTSIFGLEANVLVLRTSNFQGATVPRHKHSTVFIVRQEIFFRAPLQKSYRIIFNFFSFFHLFLKPVPLLFLGLAGFFTWCFLWPVLNNLVNGGDRHLILDLSAITEVWVIKCDEWNYRQNSYNFWKLFAFWKIAFDKVRLQSWFFD